MKSSLDPAAELYSNPRLCPIEKPLAGPNIFLQFYRPFAVDKPHLRMSAYSSGPASNYGLHSSAADDDNHGLLIQQQHHHGLPTGQPYQFDPHQQAQQQPFAIQANGHGEEPRELTPDKQRWKGSRLRKACDSCSIRKVRVS